MTPVLWTAPAVADLDNIHSYIARDSEPYADAMAQAIFDAVDRLALAMGRPCLRAVAAGPGAIPLDPTGGLTVRMNVSVMCRFSAGASGRFSM